LAIAYLVQKSGANIRFGSSSLSKSAKPLSAQFGQAQRGGPPPPKIVSGRICGRVAEHL